MKFMFTASSISSIAISSTIRFLRLRKMPTTDDREQDRAEHEVVASGDHVSLSSGCVGGAVIARRERLRPADCARSSAASHDPQASALLALTCCDGSW